MVPILGECADGVSGVMYLMEGRVGDATISFVAIIPVVGDVGKAGRLSEKTIDCCCTVLQNNKHAKIAEKSLQQATGGKPKYFSTREHGIGQGRMYDNFHNGIAQELKLGKTPLSKRIKMQVKKDAELLKAGTVPCVEWIFEKSPITGKSGPTGPLRKALQDAGIKIIE